MNKDDFLDLLRYFRNRYIQENEYEIIDETECHYKVKCIDELMEELYD